MRKRILYVFAMDYNRAKHHNGMKAERSSLPGFRPSKGLRYSVDSFCTEIMDHLLNREREIKDILDTMGQCEFNVMPQNRIDTLPSNTKYDFIICHGNHIISDHDDEPSPVLEQLVSRTNNVLCVEDGAMDVAQEVFYKLKLRNNTFPESAVGPALNHILNRAELGKDIIEFNPVDWGILDVKPFILEEITRGRSRARSDYWSTHGISHYWLKKDAIHKEENHVKSEGTTVPISANTKSGAPPGMTKKYLVMPPPDQRSDILKDSINRELGYGKQTHSFTSTEHSENSPDALHKASQTKIKITSLSDNMNVDDIINTLKRLGSIKRDEITQDRFGSEYANTPGESEMIREKRVAPTIIRRRVRPIGSEETLPAGEKKHVVEAQVQQQPTEPLESAVRQPDELISKSHVRNGGLSNRLWHMGGVLSDLAVLPRMGHIPFQFFQSNIDLKESYQTEKTSRADPATIRARIDATLKQTFRHANAVYDWKEMGALMKDAFYFTRPVGTLDDTIGQFVEQLKISPSDKLMLKMKLTQEYTVRTLSDLSLDSRGYTSRGVLKVGQAAIKVDLEKRLTKEYLCYLRLSTTEFAPFCSSLVPESSFVVHGDIGFLPMRNLDREDPGVTQANHLYAESLIRHQVPLFAEHGVDYNLFLMGLFHKVASRFDKQFVTLAGMAPYEDLNGVAHHLSSEDPGINTTGDAYLRYRQSGVTSSVISQVNDYNLILHELSRQKKLVVIDGDWKPDNLYRGHKVDFACVGLGLEIDDIAYYCSDASLGMDQEHYHQCINNYIRLRSLHDDDFRRWSLDGEKSMLFDQLADTAWLQQLVLRHAVMKKRDMMDGTKYRERQFYQHRIDEALHND
jgi:hypothetical protein